MQTIYVEKDIICHPRTKRIIERFGNQAKIINCEHYGEVFNLKAQNFRLQKEKPALILAAKKNKLVLPTPEGFGVGSQDNFYFSHMYNCLYDCRYCFLQGMYPSAHYVLFINYEDFMAEIIQQAEKTTGDCYFFSGYDADSLAYEGVSGFLQTFLPFFAKQPHRVKLECRSKSTNINAFLEHTPLSNVIIAFSFTPEAVSKEVEHKVPNLAKRIQALHTLANLGWSIGLRFDPLIACQNFTKQYTDLVERILTNLPRECIHSVSIGPLRFPIKMYQKIQSLYPKDKLLAEPFVKRGNVMSYREDIEERMKDIVKGLVIKHLEEEKIFQCYAN